MNEENLMKFGYDLMTVAGNDNIFIIEIGPEGADYYIEVEGDVHSNSITEYLDEITEKSLVKDRIELDGGKTKFIISLDEEEINKYVSIQELEVSEDEEEESDEAEEEESDEAESRVVSIEGENKEVKVLIFAILAWRVDSKNTRSRNSPSPSRLKKPWRSSQSRAAARKFVPLLS